MTSHLGLPAVFLMATFAVAGCGSDSGDSHGHDAATVDASDRGVLDATPDVLDAAEPDATLAVCAPPCGTGFVCCFDVHGHNPQCTAGATCP